jgi:hypothetical protein
MPSPTPEPYIHSWFNQLKIMQADSINAILQGFTPLQFANATIATYMLTPTQQNTFLANIQRDLKYFYAIGDLAAPKTFRALLDNKHLLENDIYNAIQPLSAPPLDTASDAVYYPALSTTAFPGGSTGERWADPDTGARALLMASMDPSCFTLAFRLSVDQLVDKPTPMGAVIKAIAVLG